MQERVRAVSARCLVTRPLGWSHPGAARPPVRRPALPSEPVYGEDVLTGDWRRRKVVPEVDAEPDLVVEDAESGFCGAVVGFESGAVVLEDRFGKRRNFPLVPAAFLLDGQPVTLRRPVATQRPGRQLTASGSTAVPGQPARV